MIDPENNVARAQEMSPAVPAETLNGRQTVPAFSGQPDDLPNLFAATPNVGTEDDDPLAAMRNDPNYAELIRELEYIARQAKELFANVEEAPSDEVWKKISSELPPKGQ